MALVQGKTPAEDSVVEQKPPMDNSVEEKLSNDEAVLEQKSPAAEGPKAEQDPLGDESVC